MKIYSIAMFLMMVNLSIAFLVSTQILPVQVATLSSNFYDFEDEIPENISYSNSDIGMYLFGDFPRALMMLGKIFFLAPITLPLLMNEAGFPYSLTVILSTCLYAVYLVGVAQIVMKYSVEGNA